MQLLLNVLLQLEVKITIFFEIFNKCSFFFIVYVVISAGNSGRGGLQTTGAPANEQGVMSIGSIDSQYLFSTSTSIIIAPNGKNIVYTPSTLYGGWRSTMNLTIIVNSKFSYVLLLE